MITGFLGTRLGIGPCTATPEWVGETHAKSLNSLRRVTCQSNDCVTCQSNDACNVAIAITEVMKNNDLLNLILGGEIWLNL